MSKCISCKHLFGRDVCWFCGIKYQEIPHPCFMGGAKKCPCYERNIKEKRKFKYPQKKV